MWYLVLYLNAYQVGSAITVIPEKYPTEEACHAAAKPDKWSHSCILAPTGTKITAEDLNKSTPYQGYYCGQYPEKCKIDNPDLYSTILNYFLKSGLEPRLSHRLIC